MAQRTARAIGLLGTRSAALRPEMSYVLPTKDEIRFLITRHWREHQDRSKRALADDLNFVDQKVRATDQLLRNLIRGGMQPLDAESQAMREVALTD
jgi:hypothetical protein